MIPQVSDASARSAAPSTSSYRLAFILVTSLFFMWGLSYGLLDVLNKHFQETLSITRARSAWLQAAYFGAYFLLAMPAAAVIGRFGYKFAILCGLGLFASGALLVIPATLVASFTFFLGAMFVIASGLAFLETAANPYVTLLGDPAHSARRLNLSQSFNGLGQFVAPLIAANVLFSDAAGGAEQAPVRAIYGVIAAIVIALAVLTWRTAMPVNPAKSTTSMRSAGSSVWASRNFRWGVFAQFFYVAAQVGVGAFFINFLTETQSGVTSAQASRWLSIGLLCFLVGRFAGTAMMTRVRPARLLMIYALINLALISLVMASILRISAIALIAVFFFMSIMFPTIFALAVRGLGEQTEKGSSYLIMSIVGGAIVPPFMGWIADVQGIAVAFAIPLGCFAVVAIYGAKMAGAKMGHPDVGAPAA
jgi:FHS family L-fucose permease-like MFS transporter